MGAAGAGAWPTASTMRRSSAWRASSYAASPRAPDCFSTASCSSCWRSEAISAAAIGYPELPASINQFSGLVTVRNLWDFGPRFDQGILDVVPGMPTGSLYATVVPKVDAHGNDLGGIRTPDVTAPLGTSSGWALRSANFGGKADGTDGCEAAGQFVPFALNEASKVPGDPRPSLQTLYGSKAGFVAARVAAAQALQAQGLLLPADAENYRVKAERTFSTVANPNYPQAYVYSW